MLFRSVFSRVLLAATALFTGSVVIPRTSPDAWAPVADPAGLRLEHFVLELREPALADAKPLTREVGVVCLRSRPVEGGRQLESESLFLREGEDGDAVHVLHIERPSGRGPELVWREWGAGHGRCFTAEWTKAHNALQLVENSRGGVPRATIPAGRECVFPLELIELAREGRALAPSYARLDPLSRELELVDFHASSRNDSGAIVRDVELSRADGSLAGRFEFRGSELVSFRWQDGDLRARRISAESYAARAARSAP